MKRLITENELPDKWFLLESSKAELFNKELTNEICTQHILNNIKLECIARQEERDNFLFYSPETHLYYVVHLTWYKETKPEWPFVTTFTNKEDFIDNWKRIYE